MKRFFIACGGTGGHLFPGLAVAERLRDQGAEVRLIVSKKEIDRQILSAHSGYKTSMVEVTGWPGVGPKAVGFFLKFIRSYRESVRLLREEPPDAVLGMGGFTCVPMLLAATRRKIPTFLHESNVIPGKATRLLARRVNRVLVGFEECRQHLPGADVGVTGTPVRTELAEARKDFQGPDAGEKEKWGFPASSVVLAVMGGSQGATGINRLVMESLKRLPELKEKVAILHLAGAHGEEEVRNFYNAGGWQAQVFAFSHDMARILKTSDLVVARAGAATVTECAWFALPAILVPYPHAAEDHQKANAEAACRMGAGVCVEEGPGDIERMTTILEKWIQQSSERDAVRRRLQDSGTGDATAEVVEELNAWTA